MHYNCCILKFVNSGNSEILKKILQVSNCMIITYFTMASKKHFVWQPIQLIVLLAESFYNVKEWIVDYYVKKFVKEYQ